MSKDQCQIVQLRQTPGTNSFQLQQQRNAVKKFSAKRKHSCWIEDFYNKSVLGS